MDKEQKREEFKRLRAMLQKREAHAGDTPSVRPALPRKPGMVTHDDLRRLVARRKVPASQSPEPVAAHKADTPSPICYRRDLPRNTKRTRGRNEEPGPVVALETAVPGTVLAGDLTTPCYLVTQPVEAEQEGTELNDRFVTQLDDPGSELTRRVTTALDMRNLVLEDFVFMDIESTGLSSSPLFLIGVMVWEANGFVVRQYLARHYGEERAVLAAFHELCDQRRILVTFNGKSFDFPFIRTRCAATGIPFSLEIAHLDLLHLSRRIWKGRLPDCKLQTLEWHVCRRMRYGDIPGSEIPDAYHAFVHSGNARRLAVILKHNKLDLITLADLMTRFPDEC